MKKTGKIAIGITYVFITFMFLTLYVGQHELAHVKIFEYYGCPNTSVHFDPPFTFYTQCNNWNHTYGHEQMYFLHGLNEVLGYHFQIAILLVILFSFLIMAALLRERDGYAKRDVPLPDRSGVETGRSKGVVGEGIYLPSYRKARELRYKNRKEDSDGERVVK